MNSFGKVDTVLMVVLALSVLKILLFTFASCFWSIYILEALQRKCRYYRNEVRCLNLGDTSSHQQISVYNIKTECVKLFFIFLINLFEWLALLSLSVALFVNVFNRFKQNRSEENHPNNLTLKHAYPSPFYIEQGEMHHSFQYLANNFLVMSLILIASLCMYLSARYAQLSWIKYNKIPYLIGFFSLCLVVTQFLISLCSTSIIGYWCSSLLVTVSLIIALMQYRKLKMVISWTIVDLSISGETRLMKRQAMMKKRFIQMSTLFWIVICVIIASMYIATISLTLVIVLREENKSGSYISMCVNSYISNPKVYRILSIVSWVNLSPGFVALPLIGIPYIGYAVLTMFRILWRLCKGKSEYQTHFPNHITTNLI